MSRSTVLDRLKIWIFSAFTVPGVENLLYFCTPRKNGASSGQDLIFGIGGREGKIVHKE
jgi:hypothetical protein